MGLAQRLLAAAVGLSVVIPGVLYGGEVAVDAMVLLVLMICVDEYTRMATASVHRAAVGVLGAVCVGVFGMLLWAPASLHVPAIAVGSIGLLCFAMLRVPETALAARVGVRLVAGLLYLPVLLSFLSRLRRLDDGVGWVFMALAGTWLADTGAYFAGRAFGRRKLFPRISPKKTWEGAFGGMAGAVFGAWCVQQLVLPDLATIHVVVLGAAVAWIGVAGDLVESMMKRSFGVKDSGSILPGHGGMLDRLDGVLFTAPFLWLYATFFGLG